MFEKISILLNCTTVSSEEFVAVDDDNLRTAPIIADKDILEFVQSSKNIIHSDSDEKKETNDAAPVPTSSEMRNIMKSMCSYLDMHSNGEMNNKMEDIEHALKAFQCNNSIGMAQKKHLDDFLRGRIIGRLECGRTQLEVSGNLESPRVSSPGFGNDSLIMVIRLGYIGLYARRPVNCVPLTATHCRLRLTWSREHALWTPQQWSCVMFSDESRFSLQSDSHRTLIWRAPGTRYHQEKTIERHRYGGAGWLVWGGIILGSEPNLHVQSVTMTGHIYRDVILEQHVRLLRGAMGAEFLFMGDNARPHRANIVDECLQLQDITRMDWPEYSLDLNPIEHVWDMLDQRIAAHQPLPTCLPELRRALLDEWCNIPQDRIDNLTLSMPRRCKACIASSGRHTPY
ncbi:transposable element Tcb1 transposase [Trichonephila clavipes]|nr:transposable element Tcb1 transposase [Trichonephila clavipes]